MKYLVYPDGHVTETPAHTTDTPSRHKYRQSVGIGCKLFDTWQEARNYAVEQAASRLDKAVRDLRKTLKARYIQPTEVD